MRLRCYDEQINLVGEIDQIISFLPTYRYHEAGEAELHIPFIDLYDSMLGDTRFLVLENKKAFVMLNHEVTRDSFGLNKIIWTGATLSGILGFRHVLKNPEEADRYERAEGPAETVMKHFVRKQFVEAFPSYRNIPNFEIAPDQGRGESLIWRGIYEENLLNDILVEISKYTGLGFECYLDLKAKKIIFDVIEGRDLTETVSGMRVIFSDDFNNINSARYVRNTKEYKNYAVVGGSGDVLDRSIFVVRENEEEELSGLDLREIYIDASEAETLDEFEWLGGTKLRKEHGIQESLEAEVLPSYTAAYEKDFKLGDIATVIYRESKRKLDQRITAIREIYEPNNEKLEIVFGEENPRISTIIASLERKVNKS